MCVHKHTVLTLVDSLSVCVCLVAHYIEIAVPLLVLKVRVEMFFLVASVCLSHS